MLAVSGAAFGAGFGLFEQGAKATAMGGAFAATADDPSAIFYNVAGIAQQRHTSFLAGGTLINFTNEFTGDPNDAFTSGATGQYRHHTFVPPNAYLIMPIGTNLTVGVGVFTPFGLRTNWEDPWIGRFVSRDANIKTVSVQPSIAWQTTDGRFAVGVGAEYRRARVVLSRNSTLPPGTVNVNPFTGRFIDVASAYLSSDWDNAWGWNAGVLFKPAPTWRIGASYRAPMDIDFKGDVTITQISTGNAQLDALDQARPSAEPAGGDDDQLPLDRQPRHRHDGHPELGPRVRRRPHDLEPLQAAEGRLPDHARRRLHARCRTGTTATPTASARTAPSIRPGTSASACSTTARRSRPRTSARCCRTPIAKARRFGIGWHHGPWVFDATEFALHFKKRSTNGASARGNNFNGTYRTDANLISLNLGYRF